MTEPNRAPLNDTPQPREETTAAHQLTADEPMQDGAAGGGLGGRSAAETAQAGVTEQAATPSNPDSPAVAGDAASLRAQAEAQHRSLDAGAAEPKPMPGQ